jgi:hypothetical protein
MLFKIGVGQYPILSFLMTSYAGEAHKGGE